MLSFMLAPHSGSIGISLLHLLNSQCPPYPWTICLVSLLDNTDTLLVKQKGTATDRKNIFSKHISDKRLVIKEHIFKNLLKLSNNETNNPIKNCQKILTHFTKDPKWPINT